MSWQYRSLKNEFGYSQTFDYSQCPPKAVCKECLRHYVNMSGEESCSTCRNSDDEDKQTGQTTIELENKYGFIDHILVENGEIVRFPSGSPMPVCPSCLCHVMPNRGSGSTCDACNYESTLHFEHDNL